MFRYAVAAVVFLNELLWTLFRHFSLHVPVRENLPLHLCDLSFFILLLGLVRPTDRLADLAYFLGVPGALLAMFFPSIPETGAVGALAVFRFYLTHGAIFLTGFYLTFGRSYFPPYRSALISFVVLHLYALLLFPVNMALRTNYLYLFAIPDSVPASIRSLPHWGYIATSSIFFFAIFSLLWLAFPLVQRRRRRSE